MMSFCSIINRARLFSITPVRKLHGSLNSPLANISLQFHAPASIISRNENTILQPNTPLYISACGMKVRRSLQRRCRDCRLTYIDGVLHNLCSAYGRHTQRQKMPHPKATRIISLAMQSKKRPW